MLSRAQMILACLAIALLCSCSDRSDPSATSTPAASQSDSESVMTFLEIPAAAHFMTTDGESIIVEPGLYAVSAVGPSLQLLPDDNERPAILLAAELSSHEEEIDEPEAIAFAVDFDEDRDLVDIALFLPDGKSYGATGSISGISSRGLFKGDRKQRKAARRDYLKRKRSNRQEIRDNRQETRQEARDNRQATRENIRENRGETNLLEGGLQRWNTAADIRENRRDMREQNRSIRRGLPNTVPPDEGDTGHNAFNNVFDTTAITTHSTIHPNWPNAYLLTYLATLVYPEFLDQRNWDKDVRAIVAKKSSQTIEQRNDPGDNYYLTLDATQVKIMHDKPQVFIDEYVKRTKHLFAPANKKSNVQYAFLHGSGKEGWDPEAMVISTDETVIVVFRGTDEAPGRLGWFNAEWRKTNFRPALILPNHGQLKGRVHKGFWSSLVYAEPTTVYYSGNLPPDNHTLDTNDGFAAALAQLLDEYGVSTKKLWITGHSLGGAQAQLFATYLAANNGPKAQGVYAIASPKVGNDDFVEEINKLFTSGNERRLLRFEFMEDPVPMAPIKWRYKNAGCRFAYSAYTEGAYPNLASKLSVADCNPKVRKSGLLGIRSHFTFHYPHLYLWAAYGMLDDDQKLLMPDRKALPLPTTHGDAYPDANPKGIQQALAL